LDDGEIGRCGVKGNSGGRIRLLGYGSVSYVATEPMEKKPFYHFMNRDDLVLSLGFWGCQLKCAWCVPGDTLIKTESGLKRIDEISDGEMIYVYDDSSQQLVLARVGCVSDREVEEVLELEVDGQTIQLTPEHPVLTKNRGWVKAENLSLSDEVLYDKTYLEQHR